MQILALSKMLPAANPDGMNAKLAEEARRGWDLYKTGFIRQWYFRSDQPGVVLILEAASIEDAKASLATSPFVQAGFIEFEVIPLGPYVPLEAVFAR